MAGIPVHTESPISDNSPQPTTAAKPDTSTAGPTGHRNTPASIPAATTTATSTSNYTPAQPGAAPVPAPTSTATASPPATMTPTRTIPPPVTNTGASNNPPPPQPGQVPSPYIPASHSVQSSVPPPPRAGQVASSSTTTASVPPVQTNATTYPPPHPSSSTYSSAAVDLSHPPGYSQNVRETFEDRNPADNFTSSRPVAGGILDNNPSSYLASGGIGGPGARTDQAGTGFEEGDSMWDTATKWAKAAGQKLSDGEQQIWKMVNGPEK